MGQRSRRYVEDGEPHYECGHCGADTTDPDDVLLGHCKLCEWSEPEVAGWVRDIVAAAMQPRP